MTDPTVDPAAVEAAIQRAAARRLMLGTFSSGEGVTCNDPTSPHHGTGGRVVGIDPAADVLLVKWDMDPDHAAAVNPDLVIRGR